VATVVWTVVFWRSAATLPTVNSAVPPGAPADSTGYVPIPTADLVIRAGQVVAIDPGTEAPGEMVQGQAWFDYRLRPEFEGRYVSITGMDVPAERAAAHAAYVAWLAKDRRSYWRGMAASLKAGDSVDTLGYKWRRMGQMVLATISVPAWVISLAWTLPILMPVFEPLAGITRSPEERERLRRRRALALGKCPGCGYSIAGLPKRRCPECNETWAVSELTA
jgi:hypothetical protein